MQVPWEDTLEQTDAVASMTWAAALSSSLGQHGMDLQIRDSTT